MKQYCLKMLINSVDQELFETLIVTQLIKKLLVFLLKPKAKYHIHKC
jgi:hypothetical protein